MILTPKPRRKIRIGLVAGGLGTYWPQFPHLLPQLEESARYVSERFQEMDAEVTALKRSLGARTHGLKK